MICPKCHAEYREGFYNCADCSVPLVIQLPKNEQEPQPEYYTGDFVEIFQTSNQSTFLTVKLAFEEESIPSNFSGDVLLGDRATRLARFFVPSEYKDRALKVLNEININAELSS